jgi:hypothetical protein
MDVDGSGGRGLKKAVWMLTEVVMMKDVCLREEGNVPKQLGFVCQELFEIRLKCYVAKSEIGECDGRDVGKGNVKQNCEIYTIESASIPTDQPGEVPGPPARCGNMA